MTKFSATLLLLLSTCQAFAQTPGTLAPKALPAIANPQDPSTPAKELFGRVTTAAPLSARAVGNYARGCMAGGQMLPVNGQAWQVMRLSRNRNWAHPEMIDFLEKFSTRVPKISNWKGILVGDMSQPRGGPMLTGHASHQVGLDADIWLTPMPQHNQTREEREMTSAIMMVRQDRKDIDERVWTQDHTKVIREAAIDPRVERILVNAAIKKAMCREASGNRAWLSKIRPYYGHDYHFHIRLFCPKGDEYCEPQAPVVSGDGCGDLDYWFSDAVLNPPKSNKPYKPKPPMTMAALPQECKQVLLAK